MEDCFSRPITEPVEVTKSADFSPSIVPPSHSASDTAPRGDGTLSARSAASGARRQLPVPQILPNSFLPIRTSPQRSLLPQKVLDRMASIDDRVLIQVEMEKQVKVECSILEDDDEQVRQRRRSGVHVDDLAISEKSGIHEASRKRSSAVTVTKSCLPVQKMTAHAQNEPQHGASTGKILVGCRESERSGAVSAPPGATVAAVARKSTASRQLPRVDVVRMASANALKPGGADAPARIGARTSATGIKPPTKSDRLSVSKNSDRSVEDMNKNPMSKTAGKASNCPGNGGAAVSGAASSFSANATAQDHASSPSASSSARISLQRPVRPQQNNVPHRPPHRESSSMSAETTGSRKSTVVERKHLVGSGEPRRHQNEENGSGSASARSPVVSAEVRRLPKSDFSRNAEAKRRDSAPVSKQTTVTANGGKCLVASARRSVVVNTRNETKKPNVSTICENSDESADATNMSPRKTNKDSSSLELPTSVNSLRVKSSGKGSPSSTISECSSRNSLLVSDKDERFSSGLSSNQSKPSLGLHRTSKSTNISRKPSDVRRTSDLKTNADLKSSSSDKPSASVKASSKSTEQTTSSTAVSLNVENPHHPDVVTNSISTELTVKRFRQMEERNKMVTERLNAARAELKTRTTGFEAMAIVVRHLAEKVDSTSAASVSNLRNGLESTRRQTNALGAKCDVLTYQRNSMISEIQSLKEEHEVALNGMSVTHQMELLAQQTLLKDVENQHLSLIESLEKENKHKIDVIKTEYENELELTRSLLTEQMEEMETKQKQKIQELHRNQESRLKDSKAQIEVVKSALTGKIDSLSAECEELRVRNRVLRNGGESSGGAADESASKQLERLEQENESLSAVVELRNEENKELRGRNMQLEKQMEDLSDARLTIERLERKLENTQAIVTMKSDHERELVEKHSTLLQRYSKESKVNQRLSMNNEELKWKLNQVFPTSPAPLRRSSSGPPTKSTPGTPFSMRRSQRDIVENQYGCAEDLDSEDASPEES